MNLLILGAAVSGTAATRLAGRLGHRVRVYDADPAAARRLDGEGCEVRDGRWDPGHLDGIDAVVTSPGIPEGAPPLQDTMAAGVPLWSEMEFAARHLSAPYLAVTGTNGKTTVTATAAAMLRESGVNAVAAGNIGTALSDVVDGGHDVVVVEASSFQLRFIELFHPTGAVILNVAPDHLDWHGSYEDYAAAKARIHERQGEGDYLVFDADDRGAVAAAEGARTELVPVSGTMRPPGGNGPDDGAVVIDGIRFDRPPLDSAFLVDVVAAATLALRSGADEAAVAAAIAGFVPGAHRRAVVGEWDDVVWVDDSKATNPHAAAAAAAAYRSVILIAGGRNKGLDLGPLGKIPTVKAVIGIGEAGPELAAATAPGRFHGAASMGEAVKTAAALAVPGDVVLLAPGCASFDMYESYAARGAAFAALVRAEMGA